MKYLLFADITSPRNTCYSSVPLFRLELLFLLVVSLTLNRNDSKPWQVYRSHGMVFVACKSGHLHGGKLGEGNVMFTITFDRANRYKAINADCILGAA